MSTVVMSKDSGEKRKRAPTACHACHKAKVKCDVSLSNGGPCTRCKVRGLDHCQTYPSRRGTYNRQEWLKKRRTNGSKPDPDSSESDGNGAPGTNAFNGTHQPKILPGLSHDPQSGHGQHDQQTQQGRQSQSNYQDISKLVAVSGPPSSSPTAQSSQKAEESWAYILEYFLRRRKSQISKSSLSFLGESSPLTTLLRNFRESGHIQIQELSPEPATAPQISDMDILERKGCFKLPEKNALETLFKYYFANVHPFHPFINRPWFAALYKKGKLPWLLVHSVCFAACHHCPSSAISGAGFMTRAEAKMFFYTKAKLLFDNNHEQDKVLVIQACILLSFYTGGPQDIWDTRAWLAMAISICENLGMHRSLAHTNMSDSDKSHLKIIWWSIANRDILTSLTFGRPPKIHLERCDVEPLELWDFDHLDRDLSEPFLGTRQVSQYHYMIESTKLTQMMHHVFEARCDPRAPQSASINDSQYQQLESWRSLLPCEVDWDIAKDDRFAMCLRILYHHQVMYIYRPRTSDTANCEDCSLSKSLESAADIAMTASKLSMNSMMTVSQDVYPSFFMTLVILTMASRMRSEGESQLAYMQLQMCKMVLSQCEGYWEHASWILKIFDRLTEFPPEQNSAPTPQNNPVTSATTAAPPMPSTMGPSTVSTPGSALPELPLAGAEFPPSADDPMRQLTELVPEYGDFFKAIFNE
uniref:ARAD1C26070p n=1 Tax=Blastobotrys adeninivorans TaxID=409370 RepID=A0A060T812_BLAAD